MPNISCAILKARRTKTMENAVTKHVYANKDEIDELLALAYFLWVNDTDSREIVMDILRKNRQ